MEIGESAAEGAIRETWEEAGAKVEMLSPFAQLDIPLIGQVWKQSLHYPRWSCVHLLMVFILSTFDDFSFLFETDLYNLLSKVEGTPLCTGSRVVWMPAFCTWWNTLWFSGIFINVGYLKIGRGLLLSPEYMVFVLFVAVWYV